MKHIISLNKLIFKQLVKLLQCNKIKFLFQSLMGFIVFGIFTNYNNTLIQTIVVNTHLHQSQIGRFSSCVYFLDKSFPPPSLKLFSPSSLGWFYRFFFSVWGKTNDFLGGINCIFGRKVSNRITNFAFWSLFFYFFPPQFIKNHSPQRGGGRGVSNSDIDVLILLQGGREV